jgi:D-alanyl-D-alanine endopeptidase (penicillin-binding protein 7)
MYLIHKVACMMVQNHLMSLSNMYSFDSDLKSVVRSFWVVLSAVAFTLAVSISGGLNAQATTSQEVAKTKRSAQAAAPKQTSAAKSAPKRNAAQASQSQAQSQKVKKMARVGAATAAVALAARPSFGQLAGLHQVQDHLDLKSSVAFVMDQDTQEVLLSKNEQAVLPIASLTKLMTGLLISESKLHLDDMLTITQDDVDTEKGSSSRLKVGTSLSRGELMHLSLMSSENRAASALGRTYPGGMPMFVQLMNAKARQLGMSDTVFVEPTGLSSKNQSSAKDLAMLVNVASQDPMLRDLSTSHGHQVAVGRQVLQYNNTNRLVKNPSWDIGLQKTGYISEAGQCLVMQAQVAGRKLIMVFLDSAGKLSRVADAERVRRWLETTSFKHQVNIQRPAVDFISGKHEAIKL